ncbi:MAG: hypothetical protein PHX08_13270 [Lachnospiraceae bacterium]|nr:hypothetical protein [Lachnospiraceae bacterium]
MGIEIIFSSMPSDAVRKDLVQKRWRYSGFKKCWYNRFTIENELYAKKVCGLKNKPESKRPVQKVQKARTANSKPTKIKISHSPSEYSSYLKSHEKKVCAEAQQQPLGVYCAVNPNAVYRKKRSFFS